MPAAVAPLGTTTTAATTMVVPLPYARARRSAPQALTLQQQQQKQQQHHHRRRGERVPFRMSVDDIDSHKLTCLLGYLDTHKGKNGLTGLFSATCSVNSNSRVAAVLRNSGFGGGFGASNGASSAGGGGGSGGGVSGGGDSSGRNVMMMNTCVASTLRRSNSDGNLNMAGIEETKETPAVS